MEDLPNKLRNDDPISGIRPSLAMAAADRIEELEKAIGDISLAWVGQRHHEAFELTSKVLGLDQSVPFVYVLSKIEEKNALLKSC